MIVAKDTDFIGIACAATKITEAAHTAYWLNHVKESLDLGEGNEAPGYLNQEGDVLSGIREIAALLGFRLERINQPALEAAE